MFLTKAIHLLQILNNKIHHQSNIYTCAPSYLCVWTKKIKQQYITSLLLRPYSAHIHSNLVRRNDAINSRRGLSCSNYWRKLNFVIKVNFSRTKSYSENTFILTPMETGLKQQTNCVFARWIFLAVFYLSNTDTRRKKDCLIYV